jgi:hypothetical protein
MTIEGLQELEKLFRQQPRLAARAARASLREAAKVGLGPVRSAAPRDTGFLQSELYVASASNRDLNAVNITYGAKIAIRPVRKKYAANKTNKRLGRSGAVYLGVGPAYYGRFTEFGFTARDGSFVPGTGWMGKAFESARSPMIEALVKAFRPKFEQAVARAAKAAQRNKK